MALAILELAEQVRAEAHRHAGGLADFEGAQPLVAQALELVGIDLRQPDVVPGFEHGEKGHQRRHHEGPGRGRHPCRLLVDLGAVLDGAHAELGAAAHRVGRVRVCHHVGPPRRGFLYADADLLVGVLVHPERVGRREHAARDHHLDLVGALAQMLAHRLADGIDPVGHLRDRPVVGGAAAGLEAGLLAHVAVAAGLAQRLAREEDPGARDQAALHRHGEAEVGAAGVAHRGEAPPERALQAVPRLLVEQRRRNVLDRGHVDLDEERVEVGVDQPRHERAAAAGDACRLSRRADRAVGDLPDPAVFHHHGRVLARLRRDPVEDPASLEDDRHGAAPLYDPPPLPGETVGRPPRVGAA